jgi:hypothetical protein
MPTIKINSPDDYFESVYAWKSAVTGLGQKNQASVGWWVGYGLNEVYSPQFKLVNVTQWLISADEMTIFGLPSSAHQSDWWADVFLDRLERIFDYGLHIMKYPIFGMIKPVEIVIDKDETPPLTNIGIKNIETGQILNLFNEMDYGTNYEMFDPDIPRSVKFDLTTSLYEAKLVVASLFGNYIKNIIEPVKDITLPTGERAEVDEAIDKLEAEMERYKFTHKGAPSSYPELAKLIGKYEEYGRLMLRQAVIPRENPKKKK